jgi:hypothetical protein
MNYRNYGTEQASPYARGFCLTALLRRPRGGFNPGIFQKEGYLNGV